MLIRKGTTSTGYLNIFQALEKQTSHPRLPSDSFRTREQDGCHSCDEKHNRKASVKIKIIVREYIQHVSAGGS